MNCGERYEDRFIFTVMYTADVAVELKSKKHSAFWGFEAMASAIW